MKVKNDHGTKFSNLSNWKENALKNQGFNRFKPVTSANTGMMLYQVSYEATHWERGQYLLGSYLPMRSEIMWEDMNPVN